MSKGGRGTGPLEALKTKMNDLKVELDKMTNAYEEKSKECTVLQESKAQAENRADEAERQLYSMKMEVDRLEDALLAEKMKSKTTCEELDRKLAELADF